MKPRWTIPVQSNKGAGPGKPRIAKAARVIPVFFLLLCLMGSLPGMSHMTVTKSIPRGETFFSPLLQRLVEPFCVGDQAGGHAARGIIEEIEQERSIMARTPSMIPLSGTLTSRYGWRDSPFTGKREFHKGLDIASEEDSPVYAPADGVVSSCSRLGSFGNTMEIDHGSGVKTLYGHLKKSAVRIGQKVKRGDRIAYLGDSGRSTGFHLHYEVIVSGVSVDPQRYVLK